MKISPGVSGFENYSLFFACALHTNAQIDKRKLKKDKTFIEKTKNQLGVFLEKYEYTNEEIKRYFNI